MKESLLSLSLKPIHLIKARIRSNDHNPPHVEVFWPSMKSSQAHAKFYLNDLTCYYSQGFSRKNLKRIEKELKDDRHYKLLEGWRQIHGEDHV